MSYSDDTGAGSRGIDDSGREVTSSKDRGGDQNNNPAIPDFGGFDFSAQPAHTAPVGGFNNISDDNFNFLSDDWSRTPSSGFITSFDFNETGFKNAINSAGKMGFGETLRAFDHKISNALGIDPLTGKPSVQTKQFMENAIFGKYGVLGLAAPMAGPARIVTSLLAGTVGELLKAMGAEFGDPAVNREERQREITDSGQKEKDDVKPQISILPQVSDTETASDDFTNRLNEILGQRPRDLLRPFDFFQLLADDPILDQTLYRRFSNNGSDQEAQ